MVTASRRSAVLGPDGQSFEVALLDQEIATATRWGWRDARHDTVASGLTPERLGAVMREAAQGQARAYLTLAMEIEERYLHYASQLQVRRLALDAIEPSVVAPKGVPARIVDAVHALVDDPEFRNLPADLMDGVAKGYSVVELIWDYRGGLLRPTAYKHRDPRFFQFDQVGLTDLRLIPETGPVGFEGEGEPLAAGKFVQHMPRIRTGIPIRRGLARSAAWAFIVQSFALQDWSAFAEVYGIPFRVGRYGPNASDADKRTLLRAVRNIANDGAAIMPIGMELEFFSVQGNHGEAVFGNLIGYIDRQVSKVVLGQTMTSDDGASLGQAKVHNEVRLDIRQADCRGVVGTINRDVIRWFVAVNFGPQEVYPAVHMLAAEPEDVKALTEGLSKLVPLGLRVDQREVRRKMGLSEPAPDAELLAPAAAARPGRTRPAGLGTGRLAACDPYLPEGDDWELVH